MIVLDGRTLAGVLRDELRDRIARYFLRSELARVRPGLATILVGDDPASAVYVRTKKKACEDVGIASFGYAFPSEVGAAKVRSLIGELNVRADVHGILLQLPLPAHLDTPSLIEAIDPTKDVDGLHPVNQGRLVLGQAGLRPCTPLAVMHLINKSSARLEGKRAVVVGRSNLVGKPLALLLLERNATDTTCHSHTDDLAEQIAQADIVVAAIGSANVIKGEWIKKGAIVIDVGISRIAGGGLTGDVDFEKAKRRAGYISPVPGGVGPLTVAMLLANTVDAAEKLLSDVA